MSRRKRNTAAFSLFAFQDIITSVTGIMILVTLILALELIQRKEQSPPQKTAELIEQSQAAIEANRRETEQIDSELKQRNVEAVELAGVDVTRLKRQSEDVSRQNQQMKDELDRLGRERDKADMRRNQAKKAKAKHADDPKNLQQLQEQIARKEKELKTIKQSNRVIYNPAKGSSKSPWLVEVAAGKVLVAPMGKSAKPHVFPSAAAFQGWLGKRNPNAEYFVLLVKPSGIKFFDEIRKALQQRKFDVGYDLLPASKTAIDPEKGAGAGAE